MTSEQLATVLRRAADAVQYGYDLPRECEWAAVARGVYESARTEDEARDAASRLAQGGATDTAWGVFVVVEEVDHG